MEEESGLDNAVSTVEKRRHHQNGNDMNGTALIQGLLQAFQWIK